MSADSAVPPEAYEAAEAERKKHFFADLAACRCGFLPQTEADWDAHLTRVAVDAAAPFLVAEGRRQAAEEIGEAYAQWGLCEPGQTHNASAWIVGPAEERVRRMAATSHRGYVIGRRSVGEWIEQPSRAARIAEGNTDAVSARLDSGAIH